jgi:hypothetical protein
MVRRLSVHLNAHIGTHDGAECAAVALVFVFGDAVVVAGPVDIIGHDEHRSGTHVDAQLAPLAALPIDYHTFHLFNPHLREVNYRKPEAFSVR